MTLITTANGTRLFHDLQGPPGAVTIAFSNSIGTTLEMWEAQTAALSARFRVLRYDTRGHGRSPVAARPTTMEELADDLAGLLDVLGDQACPRRRPVAGRHDRADARRPPPRPGGPPGADGHRRLPAR